MSVFPYDSIEDNLKPETLSAVQSLSRRYFLSKTPMVNNQVFKFPTVVLAFGGGSGCLVGWYFMPVFYWCVFLLMDLLVGLGF